jgi:hypothetical protein
MGVEVQLVTSAVRPIPEEWNSIGGLHLVVSNRRSAFSVSTTMVSGNLAGRRRLASGWELLKW